MLQILLFEKAQASIIYSMVSGIFSFVARVYDVMLKLAGRGEEAGSISQFYLSDVATAIYTLAGIFMLFRVTIAAINMIINPDAVNDGKAGAGKLLTRIIISLAMLILFVPNGWIFGDDGILIRLEKALLAEGGLINNLVPDPLNSNSESKNKETVLVDNVSATPSQLECYYIHISGSSSDAQIQKSSGDGSSKTEAAANKSSIRIDEVLHLTLYNGTSGKSKLCYDDGGISFFGIGDQCGKFSYTADAASPYSNFTKNITWDTLNNGWPSTYNCPNQITTGGKAVDKYTGDGWYDAKNAGNYVGGWHTEANMRAAVSQKDATTNVVGNDEEKVAAIRNTLGLTTSAALLVGVSDDAIDFAQMAMGTFITCSDGADCDELKAGALVSTSGDDAVVEAMAAEPPQAHLDFLPAVVAGIGILVWLVVLCVDVIIRRFKLMLLEMIAPIPIISYSDPNDKMFDEWRKMYIATYIDLFLKLIAISFAVSLLNMLWAIKDDIGGLIELFFYIIAILIFAKAIPSMISKIFGIDNLGGSFKDIVGMGKKALGFGAGAALGAVTGAATGAGLGRLTGFTAGAFKGAKSGMKGDLTGGAKSVAATNALKKQGLDWFDRARYKGLGALGIDPYLSERGALAQTEQARTQIENLQKNIDGMDQMIDRTPEVAAFARKINNGVIQDSSGNKQKAIKEAFASAYDSGSKTLNFSDIEKTGSYQKLSDQDKVALKSEYNDTYGEGADLQISGGFRAGYMTSKSAAVNAVNLLRQDKETVALLQQESITGKRKDGELGAAEVLLEKTYDQDTSYDTFINEIKAMTYGPQGELNNLMAQQSQDLSFKDKTVQSGK